MKALHIITGLGVGGAEQQLRLLLRRLPVDCDVVTLTNPGAVAEGLRADGVRVFDLGMRGNRDLTALPRLTRLIRRGRYDLVHTHLYRACVYGRLAARLAGVRATVATEHSLGDAEIEGRPLTPGTRALYLATERLGTATVAVSDTVAARLREWGVPAGRIHVVPNGIDAARFRFDAAERLAVRARLGIAPGTFVVGGVGRLVPGKRFDVLVRAVAALPGTALVIAGDGPERASLERLAAGLGVTERVCFPGECDMSPAAPGSSDASPYRPPYAPARIAAPRRPGAPGPARTGAARGPEAGAARPDGPAPDTGAGSGAGTGAGIGIGAGFGAPSVPSLLCALDAFVSASREEAFGLAVVEALAAGLPVLHSTCPAIDDLPPHQAPGAQRFGGTAGELAAVLRTWSGAGARRLPPAPVARHYDIEHSGRRLMDLYTRVLAVPAPRTHTRPTERAPR
ncbi:glycosyltransferase [Streptomyces sp. NPDC004609]|uniref:glycosyltransferase n=1 Tax=Streptomyces sp. NPDC004609 TaxID=3364704 RepID=UPI00368ABDF3